MTNKQGEVVLPTTTAGHTSPLHPYILFYTLPYAAWNVKYSVQYSVQYAARHTCQLCVNYVSIMCQFHTWHEIVVLEG